MIDLLIHAQPGEVQCDLQRLGIPPKVGMTACGMIAD